MAGKSAVIKAGELFTVSVELYFESELGCQIIKLVFNPLSASGSDNSGATKIHEAIVSGFCLGAYKEDVLVHTTNDVTFGDALKFVSDCVEQAESYFEAESRINVMD